MKVGDEFSSFDKFEHKLLQWSAATSVIWVKSHSRTVQAANRQLSSTSKPFNPIFRYRNVVYRCKHGGSPRQCRQGLRPKQSSFKLECKARLFLTINKEKTKLVVQSLITEHNHEVSKELYKHYPEQRRLSETNLTEVETMLQLGIKVKYLQHHIKTQHGTLITRSDLHNLRHKTKTGQIHRKRQRTKSPESKLDVRKRLKKNPSSKIQMYNEMTVMFKAISDFASTLSTSQLEEMVDALATMYDTWRNGEKVIFTTAQVHVDEPCYHCGKIRKTSNFPSSPSNNNNILPSSCTYESITDCETDTTITALPSPLPVKPQKIIKVKTVKINKNKLVTSASSAKKSTKLLTKTTKVRKNVAFEKEMKTVFKPKQKLHKKINTVTVFKPKQKLQKKINTVTVFKPKQKLQKNRKLKEEEKQNVNVNIVDESDEVELIGDPREMLTDMHINAAQDVLSRQFPDTLGLQDTLLGIKLQCSGESGGGGFVQIIHDGPLHWLTASNLLSHDNCVDIFDSLTTSVSMPVKVQAASLMMSQNHTMTINMINCHRQKGVYDCGLFAIAYATDLCFGNDPGKKVYTQSQMRDHLLSCLVENKLRPFPGKDREVQRRVTKAVKVKLHCICRLPDNTKERMGQCGKCKQWFHKSCLAIPTHVFDNRKSKPWYCTRCIK